MFALERLGLSRRWIAAVFLLGPVVVYAGIGLAARTMQPADYCVAGRRAGGLQRHGHRRRLDERGLVHGLTGILYVTGFGGLAYVIGWTGGFCPDRLRPGALPARFGQYTIPDFLAERYGGWLVRVVGLAVCALICFIYVVAQIYGVGLITSRLTGFAFELGVLVGLGGILVCSFLGGMRAVTWFAGGAVPAVMLVAFPAAGGVAVVQTDRHPAAAGGRGGAGAQARRARAAAEDDPAERQVMEAYRAGRRYDACCGSERSLAQGAPRCRRLSEAITAKRAGARDPRHRAQPARRAAGRPRRARDLERARRQACRARRAAGGMPVHAAGPSAPTGRHGRRARFASRTRASTSSRWCSA